ncbi:MAG TPA: ATP-binding protein [Anaerolineales bacterium]|nr:ATP-binding protein [Anaerolineales bacterium]
MPPTKTRPRLTLHSQSVPAQLGQLESLCNLVDLGARSSGFDDRTSYACQLAVCEAAENIILHGYRKKGGDIRVTTRSRPGELTVDIVDTAPPFNPTMLPPEEGWALTDPPVGGRGILIMRRVMDEIQYRRRGNRNILRMRKRVRPSKS